MLLFLRRAGRLSPDEAIAERLLAGQDAGPGASSAEQALGLVFKAAARPGTGLELSGEETAVAAFVRATTTPGPRAPGWHARAGDRPIPRRVPILAATAAMTIIAGLCGTAAADALPAPLQRLAHTAFGAPAPAAPGRLAPAVSVSPHGGATPGRPAVPSHPGGSPGSAGKTGQSTRITREAKATPIPAAAGTASGNGNSGGNGNGKAGQPGKGQPGGGPSGGGPSGGGPSGNGGKAGRRG